MNTQLLGIPSTVRLNSADHLIPRIAIRPTLIERLAASHAAVLDRWNRNFALDLRRPQIPSAT